MENKKVRKVKLKLKKGLLPLKGKINKRKIFGFDTETANNNQDLVCLSIVGKDHTVFFDNKQDFINELTSNRIYRHSFICATNLLFDLFSVFGIEEALSFFKIIERHGSLILAETHIKYDKNDNRLYSKYKTSDDSKSYYPITFVDSANHLPCSVEQLGQIINLPKLPKPDFLGHHPKTYQEFNYLKRYNIRDSEITYRFMDFMQDTYNVLGCNIKTTSSATSLDLMRRKYLPFSIKQEPKEHIQFCYNSFYGGRTEAFKRGIFNIDNYQRLHSYDVNSLYPFSMVSNRYPYPDGYFRDKISREDVENFHGAGYFELLSPKDINIPCLPVRTDKLRFATGNIKGHYDFNSVKHALNHGYEIMSTGKGIVYENDFQPFKGIIKDLYNKRKMFKNDGNKAELAVKIAMNSLYGKFGYNYMDKELLCIGDDLHKISPNATVMPTKDSNIYKVVTTEDSYIPNYVFPIFSLYTTSFARNLMHNYYNKLGEDHIFYTDTDCLFTDKKMVTGNDLGELKLEHEFDELCIVKPKFYSGFTNNDKNIVKVKGLHGSIKDYDIFKKLILSNDFSVETKHFRKLRSAIGQEDKKVNEIYSQVKHMGLDDDKRIWEKPNFTTKVQNSKPIIL